MDILVWMMLLKSLCPSNTPNLLQNPFWGGLWSSIKIDQVACLLEKGRILQAKLDQVNCLLEKDKILVDSLHSKDSKIKMNIWVK